ncbi:hypothetical protein NKG94_45605 [Micromonospora sp. M12]
MTRHLDGSVEVVTDLDGDGVADIVQIDIDGDGIPDITYVDSDRDGRLDTVLVIRAPSERAPIAPDRRPHSAQSFAITSLATNSRCSRSPRSSTWR